MAKIVRPRRLAARLAAFAGALVFSLAAAVTAAPGAWWAGATATGCAAAATGSHASLVVDFGTVDAGPGKPTTTVQSACVSWTRSDETGSQLLTDAGYTLSFNDVGLLCSIDGYPASGCTRGSGGSYEYWSYWHGGKGWTYAATGPDFFRVSSGGVDGWRFVAGTDSAHESPPRASAAGSCPTASPTTTTTTRRATVTTTGAPASGAAGAGTSGGPAPDTGPGSSTTSPRAGADTSTSVAAGHDPVAAQSDDAPSSGVGRSATAPLSPHPSDGTPTGAIAVLALIVVLGVAGFVISRARAAP